MLDWKENGSAALMDLSKVFDTIDDVLLLAKLHAYGFCYYYNEWIFLQDKSFSFIQVIHK